MDTNSLVAFLLLGIVLIALDGQIIYRSGRRYFTTSESNASAGGSMVTMVVVLFHLAMLGVLALISVISFGGNGTSAVIVKVGVMLLVLAAGHALTLAFMSRMRGDQVEEEILASRLPDATSQDPVLEQQETARRTRSAFQHESAYTPPE